MSLWQWRDYKRDKDLDRAHERGDHAEKLFFGCHHCSEIVSEYETRVIEAYEDPDVDLDTFNESTRFGEEDT